VITGNEMTGLTAAPGIEFCNIGEDMLPKGRFLASAVTPITKSSTIATVAPSTSSTTSSIAGVKIKKEPVDYDENQSTGSKASSDVIGNVRSFLERKATDFNQNQSSGQYPLVVNTTDPVVGGDITLFNKAGDGRTFITPSDPGEQALLRHL
jgi:hypothetical protein